MNPFFCDSCQCLWGKLFVKKRPSLRPKWKSFFFRLPVVSPNIVYSQSHSRLVLTRRAGWVWSSVIPVRDKVKEHVTVIFEQGAGRFQNVTVQPRYDLCHISCVWITNASFFQQVKEDQERTEEIDADVLSDKYYHPPCHAATASNQAPALLPHPSHTYLLTVALSTTWVQFSSLISRSTFSG